MGIPKSLAVVLSLIAGVFAVLMDLGIALLLSLMVVHLITIEWGNAYIGSLCFTLACMHARKYYVDMYTDEHAPKGRVFQKHV